jgi:hypothetical protein
MSLRVKHKRICQEGTGISDRNFFDDKFFSFLFYCVWPNLSLTSQSRAAHKTEKKSFFLFVWSRFTFITRHSRKKIRKRWQSVRSFELFQKCEFLFQRPSEKALFSPLLFASCHLFSSRWVREKNKKRLETKETHKCPPHRNVWRVSRCLSRWWGEENRAQEGLLCVTWANGSDFDGRLEPFPGHPLPYIYIESPPCCLSALAPCLSLKLSLFLSLSFLSLVPLSRLACRITCHAGKELLWRTLFSPLRDVSDTLPHL